MSLVTHSVIPYDQPPNVEAIVLVVDGVKATLPVGVPILNTELSHDEENAHIKVWLDGGSEVCVIKELASVGVDQNWKISMSLLTAIETGVLSGSA